jgi:hypothetical protein
VTNGVRPGDQPRVPAIGLPVPKGSMPRDFPNCFHWFFGLRRLVADLNFGSDLQAGSGEQESL